MRSIDKLYQLAFEHRGMKLGLERIVVIDEALGFPSRGFKSVHVAGTNGKGSVCLKIAAGLQQAGYRVGLYTSPHIYDLTERICINQLPIAEEVLEPLIETLLPYNMTYFETLTLAAFLYFAHERVDYAVIEVGLGGRLDATNIILPQLAVITSIGFDHMHYLGNTLEQIAQEKAGIIKQGVPTLIGPSAQPKAVFEAIAQQKQSPLHGVKGRFAHFEEENQAIAQQALALLGITDVAVSIVPPCRFEVHAGVVYDVAHNLSAMQRLFERLKLTFPGKQFRVVAAFSADKAIDDMLQFLQQVAVAIHLTRADHPRAALIGEKDAKAVLQQAKALAQARGEIVVVCGTFFMMSALRALSEAPWDVPHCDEPRSAIALDPKLSTTGAQLGFREPPLHVPDNR